MGNPQDNPTQMNGFDCGVFTCLAIDYLMRDVDFDFSQKDMPYLRSTCFLVFDKDSPLDKILYEISQGKLMVNT